MWTAKDVEAATGGKSTKDFTGTGASIDSRTLQAGDIFIALQGVSMDGHQFIAAAEKAGAAAAIVKEGFSSNNINLPLVFVPDTFKALEGLAAFARARTKAKIIGVTGSAGKTGTKEMLSIAFSAHGKVHASKKSFNNHWGVPLSLANLPAGADIGIFEMGMNHKGEIESLSAQVRPDIAIITTIEPAHIETLGSLEGIADAKAEIFSGMTAAGIAILNIDNPQFRRLKAAAEARGIQNILSFGEDEDAASKLLDCTLHADSSRVAASIMGETVKYRLNIPGKHIALNSLAALTAVKAGGYALLEAVEAIKTAEPVAGRGTRLSVIVEAGAPPLTVIDESYNANPASMLAAFQVLELATPAKGGRRIAILGDMLELGKEGPQLHAGLANPLLKAKTDLVFCCGPQMEAMFALLPPDWQGGHAKDSRALIPLVAEAVKGGDVVLVKGSAGSKMAYIVEALQSLNKDQRHAV